MEQDYDKKIYIISQVIIVIFAFCFFMLMVANRDTVWKVMAFAFSIMTLLLSFPSTIISRKLLNRLKRRKRKYKIDYVLLPIAFVLTVIAVTLFVLYFSHFIIKLFYTNRTVINDALIVFSLTFSIIFVTLPFTQTMLVIVLRDMIKK